MTDSNKTLGYAIAFEWKSPAEIQGITTSKGLIVVFFSGLYEVQVLDNNENNDTLCKTGKVGSGNTSNIPRLGHGICAHWGMEIPMIFLSCTGIHKTGKRIKIGKTVTVNTQGSPCAGQMLKLREPLLIWLANKNQPWKRSFKTAGSWGHNSGKL